MDNTQRNTKDKILHLLKKEEALTVNDLTDRLNITHMAVRKHLTSLEKDGLIFSLEVKQPMGRPLQTYTLTEKAETRFPKSYEGITIEFLQDIKDLHGEEAIQQLFLSREARLTEEYTSRLQDKRTSSDKLNELVIIQNEKGYMANLTQIDEETYELAEYNCPILSVAKEFKMACKCETNMLKNVLGTELIKRTRCRTEGDHHCKFLVKL